MEMGRLKYERPSTYHNKVLLGNWYEDRHTYQKYPSPEIRTSYARDFEQKPYAANNPEILWNLKLQSEGLGPRVLTDHGKIFEFLNNMSTLYDLSFNKIPKMHSGSIERKLRPRMGIYEPSDEYLMNYGNITEYGITTQKKEQWRCDNADPRITYTTSYEDDFPPPNKSDYAKSRHAIPLTNSSKMDPSFKQCVILNLRNKHYSTVKSNEGLQQIYKRRCNPITWTCPESNQENNSARHVLTCDKYK